MSKNTFLKILKVIACLMCISPLNLQVGVIVGMYIINSEIAAAMASFIVLAIGVSGFIEEMED